MTFSSAFVRFNTGEISETMGGRIDTEEYQGACKVLTNFIPSIQGPVSRRGGTRFIAEAKSGTGKARLFAFQFSATQSYLLEFGNKYVRFFYQRQRIVNTTTKTPIEIATPYSEADLDKLYFSQSGDVLFIAHPSFPLRTITRHSNVDWRLAEVKLIDGPYLPVNTGDVSITPSGTTGNVNLTASADLFKSSDVGRHIRLRHPNNPSVQWGAAEITGFTNAKQVSAKVFDNCPFLNGTATKAWRLGVFSKESGYAAAATFFEQRLVLAKGNGIYGSKTGQYETFSPTAPDASVSAEYGYGYELSSDQINDVCWLSSGRTLSIGTVGADFTLATTGGDGVIPMSVKVQRHSTYGSEPCAPVKVGATTLFIQHYGRKIRAFMYDSNTDGYIARDLTTLAPHMTFGGIKEMVLQQEPTPIVWCVLKNGQLKGVTYESEESVTAWHSHDISGGFVESIATLPAEDGSRDELYLLVKREINGCTKTYIEVMEQGINENAEDSKECFYLDCGLSYHGEKVGTVSGLEHLEGEVVSILADGAVQTEKVVENGQIQLDSSAEIIHVGLPFTSVLQTMPLAGVSAERVSEVSKKRISELVLRLYKTLGFKIGQEGKVEQQSFRSTSDVMGISPSLFTGDRKVSFAAQWSDGADVRIEQSQPLPLAVLGIFPVVSASRI